MFQYTMIVDNGTVTLPFSFKNFNSKSDILTYASTLKGLKKVHKIFEIEASEGDVLEMEVVDGQLVYKTVYI